MALPLRPQITSALAKAPAQTNSEPHDGLLKLSAELRNKIYSNVIPSNQYITLALQDDPVLKLPKTQEPPITHTCRLIRSETLPMFYANNIFFTYGMDDASSLVHVLGVEKTKWLTDLYLDLPADMPVEDVKAFLREVARVSSVGEEVAKARVRVRQPPESLSFMESWVTLEEVDEFVEDPVCWEQRRAAKKVQ